MPFEVKDAPKTFFRAMSVILATVRWQLTLVYVGDSITIFEDTKQTLETNRGKTQATKNTEINIKMKKYTLFKRNINGLGHVITLENYMLHPRLLKLLMHSKV